MLQHRARTQLDLVDDQLTGRDVERDAVAAIEAGQGLMTGGNRLDTERAGRWIGMELANGARQLLKKFFDDVKIFWTADGSNRRCLIRHGRRRTARRATGGRTCRVVQGTIRFVIGGRRYARHRSFFRPEPTSWAKPAPPERRDPAHGGTSCFS